MSDDGTNIVTFPAPQPKPAPEIGFVELQLLGEACDVQMRLHDDAGNVVAVIEYTINTTEPENFDLNRLRDAWSAWRARGCATTAL